jgi:hypothetical protein
VRRLTGLRLSQVIDIYAFRGPIFAVDYVFGGTWRVSGAQQPGTSGRYLDVEEIFQGGGPVDVPGRTLSLSTTSSLPRAVVREVVASLLRAAGVKHVVRQDVSMVAAAGSAGTPHPVFSFGREGSQYLPYSVTLRSDGAVVARSDRKRVVEQHVVSDGKLKMLVRAARRAGFLTWPGLLVPKSPQDPEAPYLFIMFEYRTVLTLPVRTAATRAFYRLLGRLMRASRLRFCSQPNESTVTPCILLPK